MLATLKAGGTIVPLGLEQPLARIRTICAKASIGIALADSKRREHLVGIVPQIIPISMHDILEDSAPSRAQQPHQQATPDTLAFVLFTSGSTGVPKGVELPHSAMCANLASSPAAAGLGRHSRTLQFSAFTFDISIHDIFGTLLSGGIVCLPSESDRINHLTASAQAMKVNFAMLTSTVASFLSPDSVPLETLVLIGESPKPAVVQNWLGHAEVKNAYGPTECSINSSYSTAMSDAGQALIIGTPLQSTRFWVVDPSCRQRLSPWGAPGLLYIEGENVARGYLGDDRQSAESFLTGPAFARGMIRESSIRRFYATGDLVRRNRDGTYTFLGRQVSF